MNDLEQDLLIAQAEVNQLREENKRLIKGVSPDQPVVTQLS